MSERVAYGAWRMALAYGGVGAVASLLWLCRSTQELLFWPPGPARIQEEPPLGLPLPVALTWRPATIQVVTALGSLPAPLTVLVALSILGVLLFLVVHRLNPTFQPVAVMPGGGLLLARCHVDTSVVAKLVTLSAFAGLPLLGLWSLATRPEATDALMAALCAVTGATVWTLLSRDGVAGDFRDGAYAWRGRSLLGLAGRGVVAGLAAAAYGAICRQVSPSAELGFARALGAVGELSWWRLAWHTLLVLPLATAALGAALAACAEASAPLRIRATRGAPGLLLLALMLTEAVGLPRYRRIRFDHQPGADPAQQVRLLRRVTGLRSEPAPSPPVLLLEPDGTAASVPVARTSFEGVDVRPDATARLEAHLRRRAFRTATARPAVRALLAGAATRWDQKEAMRIGLLAIERCPEMEYVEALLEQLRTCAASPEAARAVEALGDPRRFGQIDRLAAALIGDLHARLGRRVPAAEWYDRAGMPPTRILQRLQSRLMFARGEVRGRLLLRGAPMTRVRVGLMPDTVWPAIGEAMSLKRPLEAEKFRFVCASTRTDAAGRFRFEGLVAGRYRLLVEPPPGAVRAYVWMRARGGRGDPFVGFGRTSADMGVLDLQDVRPDP